MAATHRRVAYFVGQHFALNEKRDEFLRRPNAASACRVIVAGPSLFEIRGKTIPIAVLPVFAQRGNDGFTNEKTDE